MPDDASRTSQESQGVPPLAVSRTLALRRLRDFVPHAGTDYARLRNFDLGPGRHEHVSRLSGELRHRLILEREVVAAVLAEHSLRAAEKYVQEVCWRTYWKGWLEMRPGVWSDYRRQVRLDLDLTSRDPGLLDRYETAVNGQTGIDCFDAWARELAQTGYLHNHARMWAASIWIYTLRLPWALGADWFYRHLIDGDPASNTLSWRWVGGLHTRGKTYLARPDNIARFTRGRFRPQPGELADEASPLQEREHRPPVGLPAPELVLPTPSAGALNQPPFRGGAKRSGHTALLLTEEDLHAESWPSGVDPAREGSSVVGLLATDRRSPEPVGDRAAGFARQALLDGLSRAASHCDCAEPPCFEGPTGIERLTGWCVANGVDRVVTAWAPVGPVAAALRELRSSLGTHRIQLLRFRRAWDDIAWPHANRGFFQFRKQIPQLVDRFCSPASTT